MFVVFSEPVEPASATNTANYTISDGTTVQSARFGADALTVLLSTTPMLLTSNYTLNISGVRDLAVPPNTMLPVQRTFTAGGRPLDIGSLSLPKESLGPSSRRHGVVISEVMYHPTNRADGLNLEFIELYNAQPWFEELGGWRISGAVDYVFPSNIVIAARSYLVVAAAPSDFRAVYTFTNVHGPFANSNGLQNGSGTLRLRNARDAILFEMEYGGDPPWPASADGAGHSLILARASYGERDSRAWAASDFIGGSPGAADTYAVSSLRALVINEFLAHTDLPDVDYIELFNYGNTTLTIDGCVLSDDAATNKFVVPPNTTLPPRGFLVFTEDQLGFALSSGGETLYLKHPNGRQVIDSVRFESQENGVATGRFPDGAPRFSRLVQPTPGSNNTSIRIEDVVLNEIMFDPISNDPDDEYVELFNRGTGTVNLGGWRLRDGISFNIPAGTMLASGGYLVVARNAARLRSQYPGLSAANCIGDYTGSLANGGEGIELNKPDEVITTDDFGQSRTNVIHIPVDEVSYGTGGRWGLWAGGGGGSLELRDARSDSRLAPNWTSSDESTKSPWVTVEATGVMDHGWADAYQLHITLLGAGEALVDNIEVTPAGLANVVPNGTFESGVTGWVFQGNHNETGWESGEGFASTSSLHLRALGRGDSGANRVRTQLPSTLAPGTTVTIRARVRWLKGNPNILLRLRGNWMEALGYTLTAKNLGTPGAANSRALANAGPAITQVRHNVALPQASAPVLVTAQADDPDGLAGLTLNYRVDPGTNYTVLAMTNNGAGLFSAVLPGQLSGVTVGFFIRAADNNLRPADSTFPDNAPARECVVRWGDTVIPGTLPTYRFWLTQANVNRWSGEEKMSNKPKDVTFIYGTGRVIYNVGAWFHGSPYHSPSYNSPVGNSCDYDLGFPIDDRLLGETDINLFRPGNGGGDGTAQAEMQANWFGAQFGIPFLYHRPIFVFVNGQRRETVFHDAQQPNGDFVEQWFSDDADGDLHKIQFGFEFGDQAYGANEPGYAIVGADLNRYLTTGGVMKRGRYRATWPRRAAPAQELNDYTNIFKLVEVAKTNAPLGSEAYTIAQTSAVDVEEWFKVHVAQHLFWNPDSFSYGGGQNAFAYKPQRDTWKLFLWDIDFAFAGSPTDANLTGIGGAEHGPRNDHPPFTRLYWQALLEAANGFLTAARSNPILDARYAGLQGAGAGVASPQGIKDFIAARRTFVLSQIAANQSPFAITSNGGANFSTNRNLIALTGTAPLEVRTLLVNGVPYPVSWTSRNNWVIRIPLVSGVNTLLVTGLDLKGVPVPGVSQSLQVTYTGADELAQTKVVINEIMYHPLVPDAGFVEIHNTSGSNAFDLSGWRLQGADFTFPNGAVIEPGAYRLVVEEPVIFAETYGPSSTILGQLNGNLDHGGETLTLLAPTPQGGVIIDQVTYDDELPWPAGADGSGASLQLIDPLQDNNRSANWAAFTIISNSPPPAPQWQYVTATGNATSSRLYIYLESAGEVYIDDFKVVQGFVAEAGANSVQNGGFETALTGSWNVSANLSGSTVTTAIKHSGNASLRLLSTSAGSTLGTSIWQDLLPSLVTGQPYTASFWYLQSTNGGPLTVRLSGFGIATSVNIAPPGSSNAVRSTPGFANNTRAPLAPFPPLWLNELLPTNFFLGTSGLADRFGDRDPWVELYNGGTTSLSLDGFSLANNYTNLAQWPFPQGTVLGPKQFLLVWLDAEPGETVTGPNAELHASFRPAPDAGSVVLSSGTNLASVLDYLNYSVPVVGRSYGSFPDGAVSGRHLFSTVTPGGTNSSASAPLDVRINEWMADNQTAARDPADGDAEDWFELYNPSTNAVDLSGCFLADNLTNTTQWWAVPAGTVIAPLGYLLVWADGEPEQNSPNRTALHTSFSLAKAGEAIGLFAPDHTIVDALSFGPQTTDVSMGRFPDGAAGLFSMTNATPSAANFLFAPNAPPSLGFVPDKTVDEGSLLAFTLVGSDTNVPAQRLVYALEPGAPANASVNPTNGQFRWIPSEEQGPGSYSLTASVTDDGDPNLSNTQTFQITVNEVNNPPVLAPILSQTVNEGSLLTVTNSATDPDAGSTQLTYSLDPGAPAEMSIDPRTGQIAWTPDEPDGPGSYSVNVRVTDDADPPLSDGQTLSVFVVEVNTPPILSAVDDYLVDVGAEVTFTATATDTDVPIQNLTFQLEPGAPADATLDLNTGLFFWRPGPGTAGTTNTFGVGVSDHGSPALTAVRSFQVIVMPQLQAAISRDATSVTIRFATVPGRTYQVEHRDELGTGAWTPLGSTVPGSGSISEVTDATPADTQRFYRVVRVE